MKYRIKAIRMEKHFVQFDIEADSRDEAVQIACDKISMDIDMEWSLDYFYNEVIEKVEEIQTAG